jgi:hypothetical protein
MDKKKSFVKHLLFTYTYICLNGGMQINSKLFGLILTNIETSQTLIIIIYVILTNIFFYFKLININTYI